VVQNEVRNEMISWLQEGECVAEVDFKENMELWKDIKEPQDKHFAKALAAVHGMVVYKYDAATQNIITCLGPLEAFKQP
jgi:hypothetical protein